MADPISAGLMIASTVVKAGSAASAANYNASVDNRNAQQALQTGAQQQVADLAKARAVAGSALAAEGANGTVVGTGSALDALRQTAINAQFDVLNARAGAASKANSYYADAAMQKAKARSAIVQGVLGAGAQALTSGAFGGGGGDAASSVPGGYSFPTPMAMGAPSTVSIYGAS